MRRHLHRPDSVPDGEALHCALDACASATTAGKRGWPNDHAHRHTRAHTHTHTRARARTPQFLFWPASPRRVLWTEVFAEAGFIIPVSMLCLAEGARSRRRKPLGLAELVGVALFLGGTYLNLASEGERWAWKLDAANKGRLYTAGLWQFSRHINYWGEVVVS